MYRLKDYRGALEIALKINLPSYFYTHIALAAAYGQLEAREPVIEGLRKAGLETPPSR